MELKLTFLVVVLASMLNISIATEVSTTAPFVAQVYVPQVKKNILRSEKTFHFCLNRYADYSSTSTTSGFGR